MLRLQLIGSQGYDKLLATVWCDTLDASNIAFGDARVVVVLEANDAEDVPTKQETMANGPFFSICALRISQSFGYPAHTTYLSKYHTQKSPAQILPAWPLDRSREGRL